MPAPYRIDGAPARPGRRLERICAFTATRRVESGRLSMLPSGPMLTRDARGAILGGVPLGDLFRDGSVTSPAYVYDLDAMEAEARALAQGFGDRPHLVAYAVKANSA